MVNPCVAALTWFKNFREKLIFFWKLNILRFFKITGHNFQSRRPIMTLVALLEGTDEGLEGLDDVGEVANHLDHL